MPQVVKAKVGYGALQFVNVSIARLIAAHLSRMLNLSATWTLYRWCEIAPMRFASSARVSKDQLLGFRNPRIGSAPVQQGRLALPFDESSIIAPQAATFRGISPRPASVLLCLIVLSSRRNPTNLLHIGDVRSGVGVAKLRLMTDLTADEIASTLLARVVREVQNFAMNAMIHDGASAEEMWTHFVDHLNTRKELDGHS